jgi:hypothetical protein
MIRQAILAIFTSAVLAQPHATLAQQRGLAEQAVESSTALVVLPRSVPSEISVTSCAECKASVLKVTEKSRFFVGKQQVSLGQLRDFVSRSPTTGLYVFFEAPSSSITRVVVDGQLPQL